MTLPPTSRHSEPVRRRALIIRSGSVFVALFALLGGVLPSQFAVARTGLKTGVLGSIEGRQTEASTTAVARFADLVDLDLSLPPADDAFVAPFRSAQPQPSDGPAQTEAGGYGHSPQETASTPSPLESSVPGEPPALAASFEALDDDGTAIPPDTMGAVGPNHVMTTLNTEVRIQARSGDVLSTVSLRSFWAPLGVARPFDPKIVYDQFEGRWIFVAAADPRAATSALLVGVTGTDDPTGTWFLHKLDAEFSENAWADFPSLGFTSTQVVVDVLAFPKGFGCEGSRIFALDKQGLYAGDPASGSVYPGPCSVLAPAVTLDPGITTPYLVSTGGYGSDGERFLDLWRIDDKGLSNYRWITFSDAWAAGQQVSSDFAPQLGSAQRIITNDDRIHSVVYRNGSLWAAHTVFLPPIGPSRSAIAWYQIVPEHLATGWGLIEAGTVPQWGRIDDPTKRVFYAFPSLAVNRSNDVLIGYSRFSGNEYAGAAYAFRNATDPPGTIRSGGILKSGEAPYHKTFGGGRNRWGDYSATVVDPVNDSDMWTIQQYAALPENDQAQWSTWWGKVPATSPPSPALALTPAPLSFGYSPLGRRGEELNLLNTGAAPLTIADVALEGRDADSFSADPRCDGVTILPGEGCNLSIEFVPTSVGPRAAEIVVTSDAPGTPHRVPVLGVGGAGDVEIQPDRPTFPDQALGTASPPQTITLTNHSGDELRLAHMDLAASHPNEFTITQDRCTGTSVRQGESCTFDLVFAPTTPVDENPYRAIRIRPVGNLFVPVQVTAGARTLSPFLVPFQTNLGFGLVTSGSVRTRDLGIINGGSSPLSVQDVVVEGANRGEFAATAGGCSDAVPPGGVCYLGVTYAPRSAGAHSARLAISSDDLRTPHHVSLTGTGGDGSAAPSASLTESRLDFASQPVGAWNGPSNRVVMSNQGTAPLVLGTVSITGPQATEFALLPDRDTCTNLVLVPQAQCTVDLTFRPDGSGLRSADLVFPSNDPRSPALVELRGNGAVPAASTPSQLPFGRVDPDLGAILELRVTSSGTAGSWLHVTGAEVSGADSEDFWVAADGCSGGTGNPAGATCTITVAFSPTSPGVRQAVLLVETNSPGGPREIVLSGEAVQDATSPETTITSGPTLVTLDETPTFAFEADEPMARFECRVDGGAFAPCSSPHTTEPLALGPHTFRVRATDPAGNVEGTPAETTFIVVTV